MSAKFCVYSIRGPHRSLTLSDWGVSDRKHRRPTGEREREREREERQREREREREERERREGERREGEREL